MPSSGMVKFVSQKTCGLNVIEETPYGVSFFCTIKYATIKQMLNVTNGGLIMKKIMSCSMALLLGVLSFLCVGISAFAAESTTQLSYGDNVCYNKAYHYHHEPDPDIDDDYYYDGIKYEKTEFEFIARQEGLYWFDGEVTTEKDNCYLMNYFEGSRGSRGFYAYLKSGESVSLLSDPFRSSDSPEFVPEKFSVKISIPDKAKIEMGDYTYRKATNDFEVKTGRTTIKSVFLTRPVTTIGKYAYADQRQLTSLTLPASIKYIDDYAFAGCIRLQKVVALNNNCHVGNEIFLGCPANTRVHDQNGNAIVGSCSHKYATTIVKATFWDEGLHNQTCIKCGSEENVYISQVTVVRLDKSSTVYNGKVQKPSVTVKDSNGKALKNGTDYTVSYPKSMKNVGKYTVKVTLKGNYSGSKSMTYNINPKGTSVTKVTVAKKGFKVTWKKQATQTTGYQVQYSTSNKFKKAKTVTISKNKTTSKSVGKLLAKKKYYVRVRTYKTVKVNGKKVILYSGWSKAKSVTTKK